MHADSGQGVEGAEWLVEQQQPRFTDQSPGQRHPLGLAAGEGLGPGPGVAGQTHLLQRRQAAGAGVVGPQPEDDVVQHPGPRHQTGVLEHDRSGPGDPDLAVDLPVETGQRPQQRALAGPAATEHGDELPGTQPQVGAVDDGPAAEAPGQSGDLDHGRRLAAGRDRLAGQIHRRQRIDDRFRDGVHRSGHLLGCHVSATRSIPRTNRSETSPRTA